MIAASTVPALILGIATIWLCSFGLVVLARRSPAMRDRLRDVPSLMFWQAGVTAGVSFFVLAPAPVHWLLFLCGATRMIYEAIRIHRGRWSATRAAAVFLTPLLPLGLTALVLGTQDTAGTLFVAFFLSEAFDSFAYLGGKVFGKRLLAPKLSPNKTWEGLLTGAIVTFGIALALVGFSILTPVQASICTGVTVALASLGDLSASFGKRLAGVKDYPTVIANQGGLLDMFDSWIYVAPAMVFALQFLG